jgi:hypothetical protein
MRFIRSITELPVAELRVAGDAIETLIDLRAYLPPGGMLIMLAGRWRDDIRDALEMKPLPRAYRSDETKQLDELGAEQFGRLAGAVGILLDRFAPFMDDPELGRLLRVLRGLLNDQKAERARLAEEVKAS